MFDCWLQYGWAITLMAIATCRTLLPNSELIAVSPRWRVVQVLGGRPELAPPKKDRAEIREALSLDPWIGFGLVS
jgi:hypothetical protein